MIFNFKLKNISDIVEIIIIKTLYSKKRVKDLIIDRLLKIMMKNLLSFKAKGIIISILFLLNNKVCSTPTIEDGFFDDEYYAKYLEVGELIYELNNIDIKNAGLYEGYNINYKGNCEVVVELKPYDSDVKIFEVDVCKKTSRLIKK